MSGIPQTREVSGTGKECGKKGERMKIRPEIGYNGDMDSSKTFGNENSKIK